MYRNTSSVGSIGVAIYPSIVPKYLAGVKKRMKLDGIGIA